MNKHEQSSPFIAADWGKEYPEVAGWRPELSGANWNVGICIERLTTLYIPDRPPIDFQKPLLPSPDWINAQDNPREVAIAALERAGFKWELSNFDLSFSERPDVCIRFCDCVDTCKLLLTIEEVGDPALASYAVDCFTVLKAWADAIKWIATQEVCNAGTLSETIAGIRATPEFQAIMDKEATDDS